MNDQFNGKIAPIKTAVKKYVLIWSNTKSKKLKALIAFTFVAVISVKIFTTVLTFDWLARLFS